MKTTKQSDLKKVLLINSLLPEITGNQTYLALQIVRAVEKSLAEIDRTDSKTVAFDRFRQAAIELRSTFSSERPGGFAHWDAGACPEGFSPLWARNALIERLKSLASEPAATLMVTNLAESVRPAGKRWNRRAREEYREAIGLIRELARRWSRPSARLTLVIH